MIEADRLDEDDYDDNDCEGDCGQCNQQFDCKCSDTRWQG